MTAAPVIPRGHEGPFHCRCPFPISPLPSGYRLSRLSHRLYFIPAEFMTFNLISRLAGSPAPPTFPPHMALAHISPHSGLLRQVKRFY